MRQVSVVLVGIGGYGGTMVREIMENPSPYIKLAGVVDPYPERCTYIEELKKMNVPICASMDEFYKENSAQLAVISTPIFLHTQHILAALRNGSNVLCEKPLCSDEKDIDIILEEKAKAKRFVYVGYQWSYSDAITNLKCDIRAGKLGKLLKMRTIVLRPRDLEYFSRGIGWAGKIKTNDGRLVYDSVANNSAAHYLFNMLYVMGEDGFAAEPQDVSAELLRANDIENFDTANIQFTINDDARCSFIAAHPVNKGIEPLFEYEFEKASVYYSYRYNEDANSLLPESYREYGNIVAIYNDGKKVVYGNPNQDTCKKLHVAVKAILDGDTTDGQCGVEATAVHTRMINQIQKNFEIKDIRESVRRIENGLLYAEGLFEKSIECYKDLSKTFADFV